MNYSNFMRGLKLAEIDLDRKSLASITDTDKQTFSALADKAKIALER